MPAFLWEALDKDGNTQKGSRDAESIGALRQYLRQEGFVPVDVQEITRKPEAFRRSLSPLFSTGVRKLSSRDLSILTRQLATLLNSGLPIDTALATMVQQVEKSKAKNLLVAIRAKILEGYTFAQALEFYSHVFPDYYIATVSAGERVGNVAMVLERLSDYLQSAYQIKNKVTLALIYPIFIVLVGISVVIALLAFVMPDILKVFENMNQKLPLMTQTLIAINHFIQVWGVYFLLVISLFLAVFRLLLNNEKVRKLWHSVLLRVPVYGRLLKERSIGKFTRTLSILLESKVNITHSMNIASDVVSVLPIKFGLQKAAQKVQDGNSIHMALSEIGYFPPILLSLIASGERSGSLAEMLRQGAKNQEEDTQTTLSLLVSVFEPVMILIMGAMVLFIVVAILVPIFEMNTLIN
jgi:general secretion pathway protein F